MRWASARINDLIVECVPTCSCAWFAPTLLIGCRLSSQDAEAALWREHVDSTESGKLGCRVGALLFLKTPKTDDFLTTALAPMPLAPCSMLRTRACAPDAAAACGRPPRRKKPACALQQVLDQLRHHMTFKLLRKTQRTQAVLFARRCASSQSCQGVVLCGSDGGAPPTTRMSELCTPEEGVAPKKE